MDLILDWWAVIVTIIGGIFWVGAVQSNGGEVAYLADLKRAIAFQAQHERR